jgi:hypothetical protein
MTSLSQCRGRPTKPYETSWGTEARGCTDCRTGDEGSQLGQLVHRARRAARRTEVPRLASLAERSPLLRTRGSHPSPPFSVAGLLETQQQRNAAKPPTKAQIPRVLDRFTRVRGASDLAGLPTEGLMAYRCDVEATTASRHTRKFHLSKVCTVIAFGLEMGMGGHASGDLRDQTTSSANHQADAVLRSQGSVLILRRNW